MKTDFSTFIEIPIVRERRLINVKELSAEGTHTEKEVITRHQARVLQLPDHWDAISLYLLKH